MMDEMADEIHLIQFTAVFVENTRLSPSERSEVVRIAKGMSCKDSAVSCGVSPDTIRTRRKRIYEKLDMDGARDVLSAMLALALKKLAAPTSSAQKGA